MDLSKKILCCDWGTSNFRLYLVDKEKQKILEQFEDTTGISEVYKLWRRKIKKDQTAFFRGFLQDKIEEFSKSIDQSLKDLDVTLSGMASSTLGMTEVPYSQLPFDLTNPELSFKELKYSKRYANPVYIFGGLKSTDDVMRGEEIQLLGLRDYINEKECLCILPGTHSKHITISKGKVSSFQTFMTGEIFNVIKEYSILRNSITGKGSQVEKIKFFRAGVLEGSKSNLLGSLFKIRANDILYKMPKTSNELYLSGLLIGSELSSILSYEGSLLLGGSNPLFSLYQEAIAFLKPELDLHIISPDEMLQAIPRAQLYLMNKIAGKNV